jgi:hypothetical protein
MPRGRPKEDPETRFWKYVEVGSRGCLLWTASLYDDGYGQFWDGEQRVRAHRFAYEQFVGPIGDAQVLHDCDERRCVNAAHLFLGMHEDNMADMVRKGRAPQLRGERNGNAKLTAEQAWTARYAHLKYGISQTRIAKKYGVSPATISLIVNGKNWAHL